MRIAFVVNNYPPRVGGVELHVASLGRQLRELGHGVVVYTLHERPGRSTEDGIEVVRLPEHFRVGGVLGFPAPGTRRRLSRALAAEGIDIVSIHTRFFPLSWVGLRAAHRVGIPVVHTEHGSDHVVSESTVITTASRLVDRTVGRAILRGADAVLGVSEDVVAFVLRLSGRRGEVFFNAIEPPEPIAEPVEPRPERFVFVGRMVPGKGWDVFLDLVARLRAEGRPITAELLGDGPDLAAVRARIEQLALGEAVVARGRVDSAAVRAALRGATLVNPTVLAEGFQTTLLEALAEGGRVVTYPVPGAVALQTEGRAVRIAADREPEALLAELRAAIDGAAAEGEPPPIGPWTWPERAQQYLRVCAPLLGEARVLSAPGPGGVSAG